MMKSMAYILAGSPVIFFLDCLYSCWIAHTLAALPLFFLDCLFFAESAESSQAVRVADRLKRHHALTCHSHTQMHLMLRYACAAGEAGGGERCHRGCGCG